MDLHASHVNFWDKFCFMQEKCHVWSIKGLVTDELLHTGWVSSVEASMEEIIEEEETGTEVLEGLDSLFILMLTPKNWTSCYKMGSLTWPGKEYYNLD